MVRHGCIYLEYHNKGRRSSGNNDGNRSSARYIRGVGLQRAYGYRWVGEITYKRKRYRIRSYDYNNVLSWLLSMSERFSD